MNRKVFAVTLALLCFAAVGMVWGATTGKITGVVSDTQTKEPLVGVSVSVEGTNLGAITDQDGKYTILNVPVGTYTLKMTAVGYASLEVSNVHVSADLATYQDQELSSKATDLGKTIEVTAEVPLVIKDKTTSVNIVSGEELQALPTRGFEQVVGIQNSVVRMHVPNPDNRQRAFNRSSTAQNTEINLRGGRPSEVAYYVDGFSMQDPLTGISTATIANNAIQEVSVTSGAFSAEYGHVASGIVNVTTNSGTDEYHADLDLVSDNVASFTGYDSFDQNYYSADFSGPIPGMKKAYFFFSGERRYLADRQPSSKTLEFMDLAGLSQYYDEPQRLPNNAQSGWSYQGKIDYNLKSNLKLSLTGNGSVDYWQQYRHSYMNPRYLDQIEHAPRQTDKNYGFNAKITHTLSATTFYNLSGSYFLTSRVSGDGVLSDNLSAYQRFISGREVANPEYDIFNVFRQGDSIFASQVFPTVESGSEADTFITYYSSYFPVITERKASYIGAKGDINSQVNSHNTLKLGFDFQRHTIRSINTGDATKGYSTLRMNRFGYDSLLAEIDGGILNSVKHPINIGAYVQDRFEFRGLIVNAGLRYDYFDYKALRLRSALRPLDPDGLLIDGNPLNDSLGSIIDATDLEPSTKYSRVSPRLGISFPVSDKTQLHINYGKFFQRPDLNLLYIGYDFLAARIDAGSFFPFPSPNIEPEKTTQYEFGITHQLGENTAFDIAAYYKDVQDLVQIYHQNGAVPTAYDTYANSDYGTIKGVDLSITMRRTRHIALNLKYTLGWASGTGSYAGSTYNIAWKNPSGTPKQTSPLDYDQRHNITAIFDYRLGAKEGPRFGDTYPLENLGLNVLLTAASGTPYTPTQVYDGVSANASVQQFPTGGINSDNLPWVFSIDLKLERRFKIGTYNVTPYLWVKNLLDRDNIAYVYEGTGQPDNSGYLESPEGAQRAVDPEFAYRYNVAQRNPLNYGIPRMILVGLRMSF